MGFLDRWGTAMHDRWTTSDGRGLPAQTDRAAGQGRHGGESNQERPAVTGADLPCHVDARYADFETADGHAVYDTENGRAWIASDTTVSAAELR